jgi:hypothetical protein
VAAVVPGARTLAVDPVKLIRCWDCGMPLALTYSWLNCECGKAGGAYMPDGRKAIVAGSAQLIGISNKVFYGIRAECWPYDETNGRITRLSENPGDFPDRVRAA